MSSRSSRRIIREANAAAVRMYSEDFTEADAIAIKARCDQDPEFRERFVEAHHLLGALDDRSDELGQDSMPPSSMVKPRPTRRVSVVAASGLAAGVLIALGIWLAWTGAFVDRADTVDAPYNPNRRTTAPDAGGRFGHHAEYRHAASSLT